MNVPGVSLTLQLTATILRITSVCILPGAAIFFEFKHYKPKKKFTSTKCFAFMEMDEIKPGPIVVELWVDRFSLSLLFFHFKSPAIASSDICPPELQVQEAHRLQEEETATADKEAAVPPPPSDVTHGQLRARRLHLLKRWASFLIRVPAPPTQQRSIRVLWVNPDISLISARGECRCRIHTLQTSCSYLWSSAACWNRSVDPAGMFVPINVPTCVFWINNRIIASLSHQRFFIYV